MDATTAASTAQMAAQAPRPLAAKAGTPEQARALGKQFESMFVTQMLNHMFTGLEGENSYFGGGHAEGMFRPMLMEEYGKMIANRGNGIGLAEQVTKMLLSQQEVQT